MKGNTRPRRVLMLLENCTYPKDGRVRREATALVSAGYQVTVIAPGTQPEPWRETIDGVFVVRYPEPYEGKGLLGYLWEYGYSLLATAVLSVYVLFCHGFDVVHAHNPPDFFVIIGAFYKLFGKRFVFDHHDIAPEMYLARFRNGGNRFLYHALKFWEIVSCRLADRVIATNESYRAIELKRSGIPSERISVVRNGPEESHMRRVEPCAELRSQASTIIVYVGILGFQDGVDYLMRALQLLRSKHHRDDFYCCVLGSGAALRELEQLAHELELTDHVCFPGYVMGVELIKKMSAADIFVTPDPSNDYNDRSTMIKMMEYMALERPIVAFDLPEHRVTAGDAALYARPNDESDFAAKLATLMDDAPRRECMGEVGRQRVMERFAWSIQAKDLLDAYAALFSQPSGAEAPTVAAGKEPLEAGEHVRVGERPGLERKGRELLLQSSRKDRRECDQQ